jgi:Ca2+/Na+ antiporter
VLIILLYNLVIGFLNVGISPALAGVTFLAFANGAPDVLTAILAGASDSDSTALIPFGSIFGAFLFSTAFILSTVILLQRSGKLEVRKK